jgi:hypothetical protein
MIAERPPRRPGSASGQPDPGPKRSVEEAGQFGSRHFAQKDASHDKRERTGGPAAMSVYMSVSGHSLSRMRKTAEPPYLKPVSSSVSALGALYRDMLNDLDTDRHGFGWWHGHLDVKRIAIISEYLIASVHGAQMSLGDAAFELAEFNEQVHAHDHWQRKQLATVSPGAEDDSYLRVLWHDPPADKRDRRIRLHREHFIHHVAQTLDRLAAVVIGVGGLSTDILRADWGVLDRHKPKQSHQPPAGHAEQVALGAAVKEAVRVAGPRDWMDWSIARRNTAAHRAPKMAIVVMTKGSRQESSRLVGVFDRQPEWSETLAFAAGQDDEGLDNTFIIEDPAVLMGGILASLDDLMATVTAQCAELWGRRRDDPTLIVQPGQQWKRLEVEQLHFDGYGKPMKIITGGTARVSPDVARRMSASGLFSKDLWT